MRALILMEELGKEYMLHPESWGQTSVVRKSVISVITITTEVKWGRKQKCEVAGAAKAAPSHV